MKRSASLLLLALVSASPASAQLRDKIAELFIFGTGGDPLFLAGTADPSNPASVQAHGSHFIPASVAGNATLISFLTSAIGTNVANLPIGATSSGRTFSFVGGVPVATSTSHGPVFAERAQTLGAGRVLVGVSVNQFNFKAVRGADLNNLQLNFTHANVNFAGCDTIYRADCSKMGAPTLENDFIQLRLSLALNVRSTVFVLTYGLRDWLDIGVAVPLVSTSLRGTSEAQVVPFGGPTAAHFFAGTPSNPQLSASRFVEGSATGIGDLSARAKIRLVQGEHSAFAVLADARFATGAEDDLLGSGHTALRGMGGHEEVTHAGHGKDLGVVKVADHAVMRKIFKEKGQPISGVRPDAKVDHAVMDSRVDLDLRKFWPVGDRLPRSPSAVFRDFIL